MTHAEDGVLVRFLDGECDADERAHVAGHVERCEACAARLAQLDARSQGVRVALRAWDAAASRGRRGVPVWLKAAAVILVLLGVAGTVQPVRAWILDSAQAIWTAVTGSDGVAPDGVAALAADTPSASVAFVPTSDVFVLEFRARQSRGALSIETTDRETAVAEVRGGSGQEDLVVLPTGLRILNAESSDASYAVRLPNTLAVVQVIVAGERPLALEPGGSRSRWEIDLADSSRQRNR